MLSIRRCCTHRNRSNPSFQIGCNTTPVIDSQEVQESSPPPRAGKRAIGSEPDALAIWGPWLDDTFTALYCGDSPDSAFVVPTPSLFNLVSVESGHRMQVKVANPPPAGQEIKGFLIEREISDSPIPFLTSWRKVARIEAGATDEVTWTNTNIFPLVVGETYKYRAYVYYENGYCPNKFSPPQTQVLTAPEPPATTPVADFTGTDEKDGTVQLSWTAPSDPSYYVSIYKKWFSGQRCSDYGTPPEPEDSQGDRLVLQERHVYYGVSATSYLDENIINPAPIGGVDTNSGGIGGLYWYDAHTMTQTGPVADRVINRTAVCVEISHRPDE